MRAIQCLIISIFAILSASGTAPWGGYLGKYLLQRPFIGGLICGIVFGDITQGILIGAAMQLVYIGYFNVAVFSRSIWASFLSPAWQLP